MKRLIPMLALLALTASAETVKGRDFKTILLESLEEVNKLQQEADQGVQRLVTGETDNVAEVMHAVTGLHMDKGALGEKAAGISTLVRHFNLREGLTLEDDKLPRKLHCRLTDSGNVIREQDLERMRRDYYQLRGWDAAGIPIGTSFDFGPCLETPALIDEGLA